MSFLLARHEVFLKAVKAEGRDFRAIVDQFADPRPDAVVLRHDVDRRPAKAVAMARLEHALGVRGTYYFRCSRAGRFPTETIRAVASFGHEVGYHFEDLSRCGGNRETALAAFARNLAAFRAIAPCRTVAMHGSPLSPYDNRTLLAGLDPATWNLVGEAGGANAPRDWVYFTDAGGGWNDPRVNRRDWMPVSPPGESPHDEAVRKRFKDRVLAVNLHPERWSRGLPDHAFSRLADLAAHVLKSLVRTFR